MKSLIADEETIANFTALSFNSTQETICKNKFAITESDTEPKHKERPKINWNFKKRMLVKQFQPESGLRLRYPVCPSYVSLVLGSTQERSPKG